jgi:hypothetical protein
MKIYRRVTIKGRVGIISNSSIEPNQLCLFCASLRWMVFCCVPSGAIFTLENSTPESLAVCSYQPSPETFSTVPLLFGFTEVEGDAIVLLSFYQGIILPF